MPTAVRTRARARRAAPALAIAALALLGAAGSASAALTFTTAPALPTLPAVTLNGQQQTVTTAMTGFAVTSSGPDKSWNLTVAGLSGPGESPVFEPYCPTATCGTDTGPGYVAGGYTLPAGSLTLDTTGAGWTGPRGSAPAYQCATGCPVDAAGPSKIASAPHSTRLGTWTASGFSATSLSLSIPTTLRTLQTGEVYRLDVVWSLNTGP